MVKELVKIQSLSLPSVLHNPKVLCLIKKKIKSNLISEISIQLFPNYFPFSSKKKSRFNSENQKLSSPSILHS